MSDERLARLIKETPLDGEAEARERSWRVVQAAYAERIAAPRTALGARRLVLALAAIGLILALVLTPAGAKVVSAVKDATGIGERNAKPALTSLPAPGALVVQSPVGPWVVHDDGSKRLLGDYRQATWSPHGLYLAVTKPHELAAVTPEGTLRWTIDRPRVRDPRWSPSGVRVAYRSGSTLRLAFGDGTSDVELAGAVAPVAPAWRPIPHPTAAPIQSGPGVNVLAYVDSANRIVVLNTDTNSTLWRSAPQARPFELTWSSDGRDLVAATRHAIYSYRGPGPATTSAPRDRRLIRSAAFLPGTHQLVLSLQARSPGALPARAAPRKSTIVADRPERESFPDRRLFAARGRLGAAVPSPDGTSILVAWPAADQWLFIRARGGGGGPGAVDDISHEFDPRATGPVAFPRIEGWCCSTSPRG